MKKIVFPAIVVIGMIAAIFAPNANAQDMRFTASGGAPLGTGGFFPGHMFDPVASLGIEALAGRYISFFVEANGGQRYPFLNKEKNWFNRDTIVWSTTNAPACLFGMGFNIPAQIEQEDGTTKLNHFRGRILSAAWGGASNDFNHQLTSAFKLTLQGNYMSNAGKNVHLGFHLMVSYNFLWATIGENQVPLTSFAVMGGLTLELPNALGRGGE